MSPFFCAMMIFAKGSSPFSFAASALVFLRFLKGIYRSSISCKSKLCSIFARSSGVSFSCSSMDFRTLSFLFWISSKFLLNFWICSISTSPRFPVLSFLYRAIKGMVQSSESSCKTAFICFS